MKKTVAMITAFLLGITLCACNAKEPADKLDFIDDFNLVLMSDGYDEPEEVYALSDTQQEELERILQLDQWEDATDLPAVGFSAYLVLKSDDDDIMYLNQYEDKMLVLIKWADAPDEAVTYFAPITVLHDLVDFKSALEDQIDD